jgi:hypothetical protein
VPWLATNYGAIVAGIISSAIVLGLQIFIPPISQIIYDTLVRRRSTKRVWGISNPKHIYIVSGSIETMTGPTGLAYLAAPDAEAVAVITVALRLLFPKAKLIHAYSPNFSPDLYGADVISVGGPVNNTCTRTLMKATAVPAKFDGLDLVTPSHRYELKPATKDEPINTDYGFIISTRNPFTPGARCIIIAGCDTHGVLAAANALSPDRLQKPFRNAVRKSQKKHRFWHVYSYYAVVSAQALANTVSAPITEEAAKL